MDVRRHFAGCPRGCQMLGPLPVLHRIVLVVSALAVCIGLGVCSA